MRSASNWPKLRSKLQNRALKLQKRASELHSNWPKLHSKLKKTSF